jgi:hypothetical protein
MGVNLGGGGSESGSGPNLSFSPRPFRYMLTVAQQSTPRTPTGVHLDTSFSEDSLPRLGEQRPQHFRGVFHSQTR